MMKQFSLHFGVVLACLLSLTGLPANAEDHIRFSEQTIDAEIGKVCYAVLATDVNDDDKTDVVAVSDSAVYWYENPSWKRHTIIADATEKDNVCIAATDIDGDGKVDFALGAGWTKVGTIQWLARAESLEEPWNVYPIANEAWTHRMRFADVLGTGRPQLVVSPLNKTVGEGVRLTAFEIPQNPRDDRWMPTVLDQSLDKMHNHWHAEFDAIEPIDTITASAEGVSAISRATGDWVMTRITESGAGEVKLGKLDDTTRFIATIEPMHGTDAVVHVEQQADKPVADGGNWNRIVLDDSLAQGHALWCADFDGNGTEEILVGHREAGTGKVKGPGLYLFRATDSTGKEWTKQVIDDGGIAVEDAVVADLNGDNRPDIIAGGRATRNVRIYFNVSDQE